MNKTWYKEHIFGYECRAVTIIAEGLPKRDTLKKLRLELNKLSNILDSTELHGLWNFSLSLYKKMRRGESLKNIYRAMTHEMNQAADGVEFDIKHEVAMNLIRSDTAFYQCDSHPNCADGHRKYEGQIFINEDAATEREKEFARKHNIKSLRSVMFGEDYLLVRRNCKHRLLPVQTELVISGDIPNPPVLYEPRDTRTPAYRAYYNRRKFLIASGISKENDAYKRTVSLIKKHRLR